MVRFVEKQTDEILIKALGSFTPEFAEEDKYGHQHSHGFTGLSKWSGSIFSRFSIKDDLAG